jgi:hypothetical protein
MAEASDQERSGLGSYEEPDGIGKQMMEETAFDSKDGHDETSPERIKREKSCEDIGKNENTQQGSVEIEDANESLSLPEAGDVTDPNKLETGADGEAITYLAECGKAESDDSTQTDEDDPPSPKAEYVTAPTKHETGDDDDSTQVVSSDEEKLSFLEARPDKSSNSSPMMTRPDDESLPISEAGNEAGASDDAKEQEEVERQFRWDWTTLILKFISASLYLWF